MKDEIMSEGHDAQTCPQCQAFSSQAKVHGDLGRILQSMLDDGSFERLGERMAMAYEQRLIEALLKN